MHIWSKDERPVRFEVQDMDGGMLAAIDGMWREIVPIVHVPGTTQPAAGKPAHSLIGETSEEDAESLAIFAGFASQNVRYAFPFAGRVMSGTAVMNIGGNTVTLMCQGQPNVADSSLDKRAS